MKSLQFIGSFPGVKKCPKSKLPEFAFIGRSNVGKSSLINYLSNKKNMARTSGAPGKTQLINFFEVDQSWFLVDLPGYGYARTSKKIRSQFDKMIKNYLLERESLFLAFQLIDIRIPPQESDIEQINWMGEHQIPFCLVFTKAEKLGPVKLDEQIDTFFKRLSDTWSENPTYFISSATGKMGKEEILKFISKLLK